MEGIAFKSDRVHFFVCHFASGRVLTCVDPAMHFQTCAGAGGADQVDNDLVRFQRYTAPIACDATEQSMFDLGGFSICREFV